MLASAREGAGSMKKTVTLCRPCAEKLKAGGKKLTEIPAVGLKDTCGECGRRRYCRPYEKTVGLFGR